MLISLYQEVNQINAIIIIKTDYNPKKIFNSTALGWGIKFVILIHKNSL